jgi:hypothetical protein
VEVWTGFNWTGSSGRLLNMVMNLLGSIKHEKFVDRLTTNFSYSEVT